MNSKGVIAAGHERTVQAAEDILKSGGNAFDAAVAAHFTACVSEPVLSSLAGGGFLLAQTDSGTQILYDFFAQTPIRRRETAETEFFPITADFGETLQEFHIGMGSFATPGTVNGLFAVHRDLCTMPMNRLVEPAVQLAREGVITNGFQAYIFDIVSPVYLSRSEARRVYGSSSRPGELVREGDLLRQPEMAETFEMLAREGEDCFRRGEIARNVDRMSREHGGHVTLDDMYHYEVIRRKPLKTDFHKHRLAINPAPSSGGMLIAFALKMMESEESVESVESKEPEEPKEPKESKESGEPEEPEKPKESGESEHYPFGSAGQLWRLVMAQELTDVARKQIEWNDRQQDHESRLFHSRFLDGYRQKFRNRHHFSRGTTHISIMDSKGNTASLTTSNGEGCGYMIPGTGIMLNNMLGEEDLHPGGFHRWPENQRISSMMAPAILNLCDGSVVALGSGGSNRLRTAILQVILNLTVHRMSLEQAVHSPRIHCEKNVLSIEKGFNEKELEPLRNRYPENKIWSGFNLFFGGTHAVRSTKTGFEGAGDPRRGGVSLVVR